MGRAPCCDKAKVKRGPWSPEEDSTLKNYVERYGTGGNWIAFPHKAGLKRCGKSCRLRWLNYLRPDIKHGGFTEEEDNTILTLYRKIGSRWSVIASHLPGRTDNDVKNYWNTKLKKKVFAGNTTTTTTTTINCNISTNNSLHFSTTLVPKAEINYYGNSECSALNFSRLPYPMDVNYQQNLVPNMGVLDPNQFPLPRLMEVQENGTSAANSSFSTVSSSQEFSTLSPSFSLENSYALWSTNGGGEDDLLFGFDFLEKIIEVGDHVTNSYIA